MPTLNIQGKRVTVGDGFLKLSAEDQQKTVNEIAASFSTAPAPAKEAAQPSTPPAPPGDVGDVLSAGFTAGVNAIPIAGPTVMGALNNAKSFVHTNLLHDPMTSTDVATENKQLEEAHPEAATVGQVTGTILPIVLAAQAAPIAAVLGLDAGLPMGAQMLAGGLSNAGITAVDRSMRGDSPQQVATEAGLSGLMGGVAAPVAAGAGWLAKKALVDPMSRLIQTVRGWNNPDAVAQEALSVPIRRDVKAGEVLDPAEESAANANGIPIMNADRFGNATRTMARTVGNLSPNGMTTLKDATDERFKASGQAFMDWVDKQAGGHASDTSRLTDLMDSAARKANDPAYKAAYSAPGADAIWSPEIAQLMQSQTFRDATRAGLKTSNEEAALTGGKALDNPFVVDPRTKAYRLRIDAQGNEIQPSLEFWDHTQRALRRRSGQLAKSGEMDFDAGQVNRLRGQLNGVLDNAVPEFQQARSGAASFFGAEDALEAGKNFVKMGMTDVPGAVRAFNKFTPTQKNLFKVGHAATLFDALSTADGLGASKITKLFESPVARAQNRLAFGPQGYDELEPLLRVYNTTNLLRNTIKNGSSTIAQQAAAMGLTGLLGGAGVSAATEGLDPTKWNLGKLGTTAGLFAIGRGGARMAGQVVDQKVLQSMAKLLASQDPKLIQQAITMASRAPKSLAALKAIEQGATVLTQRGGAAASVPLAITVNGGAQEGTSP